MVPRRTSLLLLFALLAGAGVPARAAEALPRLATQGTRWVDAEGNEVVLRGANLGNWLLQEMWMHGMGIEGIPDQYTLENVLADRFGAAARDALMEAYRNNFITGRDFRIIRSFGMNVVRLPFVYSLLEDDDSSFQIRSGGWTHIDRAVDLAEAEGIYTILDLHGAPGRQSAMDHTGRADYNRLFFESGYQDRTVWLWGQIAGRYGDRSAIAAYDILNEAWGSSPAALKALALRIYAAIRAVDPDTIIILPSHRDGFEFYGLPADLGMTWVVNTMHFYPGYFGWGEPTVATHRDWLTGGIFEWRDRVGAARVPFLVGEMNVASKAAGGGEMMRHSFDEYGALGWATTLWSYKVFTSSGGIRETSWGMAMNPPGAGAPRIKADTWSCDGWDVPFAEACANDFMTFSAPGSGPVTVYLLIKAGACCGGSVDVVFDGVSLRDEETGEEKVANGGFGSAAGWTPWTHDGTVTRDFAYAAARPVLGEGPCFRIRGSDFSNGGACQALTLEGGRVYTLGGSFRDLASTPDAAWAEVYLRTDRPVDGSDAAAGAVPGADIDVNTSSHAEILAYFEGLSGMDLVVDEDLKDWLATDRSPALFEPPLIADWYAFGSRDGWRTAGTEMTETAEGSRAYRRTVLFGSPPVLERWKVLRTDGSEEHPGGPGADAWVKGRTGEAIDLLFDESPQGDGWLPDSRFLYQRPIHVADAYVAVGTFQSQIGDTDRNAASAVTTMSDDGATKGDETAGDGIYTLEVAIPAAGSYVWSGVLADRSWQTRISAVSATGDTPEGEILFTISAQGQRARFLCDISRNRVKLEILPAGGRQIPGNVNQDASLDLSDAVWLLGHLFLGTRPELPCDGGTATRPGPGARALADSSGDGTIDISDAVNVLGFLFLGGRPPALGTGCTPIAGCPDSCGSS
jgi:endoglucanase